MGQAHTLAASARLYGYDDPGDADLTVSPTWSGNPCPPEDNSTVAWVNIDMTHQVGVIMPFIADSCTPSCHKILSTEVQFRMEPEPAP